MKSLFSTLAFAVAVSAASPSYAADFFLTIGPETSSVDFGNTGGDTGGVINDNYYFTVPAGVANSVVSSIALNQFLDVDFTSVTLDDIPFDTILSDGVELVRLNATRIGAGQHVINVQGTWGEQGGSYAGTLNFSPGAVPEPATWGLMILGFGAVGGALRRRKSIAVKGHFA